MGRRKKDKIYEQCVDCGQPMEEEIIYSNVKIGTLIRLICSCGFTSSRQTGSWQAKHRGADDAKHEAAIVYELYKEGIFTLNQ